MSSFCNFKQERRQADGSRRIWLPSETWVDAFKFLSRRDLLRSVQPTCHRFHVLAQLHVDNVHVIRGSWDFLRGLEANLPEANKQYADLAASDASLAKHFRLHPYFTFDLMYLTVKGGDNEQKRRRRAQQRCVLRHSLDLIRNCELHLWINHKHRMMMGEFMLYLGILQPVRPSHILIVNGYTPIDIHINELLCKPAILSCSRLTIGQQSHKIHAAPSADSICNWLHHLPTDDDDGNEQQRQHEVGTRILIYDWELSNSDENNIIECCKKMLRQSNSPSDQRRFLLIFRSESQVPFRIDHAPTREVLHLEKLENNYNYRLRRCLIADLATSDQFYRDTFEPKYPSTLRKPVKDGVKVPTLLIS